MKYHHHSLSKGATARCTHRLLKGLLVWFSSNSHGYWWSWGASCASGKKKQSSLSKRQYDQECRQQKPWDSDMKKSMDGYGNQPRQAM